jgi:tetratricopeptide (TPR) repeat protein
MNKLAIMLLTGVMLLLFPLKTFADGSVPYLTETQAADGNLVETQTAYKPIGHFASTIIQSPEDVYTDNNNHIFIADSGLKQIIEFDLNGHEIRSYGGKVLKDPTGVCVDPKGNVYVADYGNEKVYKFASNGKLLNQFSRPTSPLFGKNSPYKPEKVAVDLRGNIFVIGDGSTNGIIQLSQDGSFLGYFGVNQTQQSVGSFLMNLITTNKQKSQLLSKIPPAPTNVATDSKGLVYSVTSGTDSGVIKKLNIAGGDLLSYGISNDPTLVAITVNQVGDIFVVNGNGIITEYNSSGQLLFQFGGKDDGTNRLGLFKQPTGISVDRSGDLYVTDRDSGMVQVFSTTAFTQMIHNGSNLYDQGFYVQSEKYWKTVLAMNASFGLAHDAMGKAYYQLNNYQKALNEYKLAENKVGYSNAYWEIRHQWLQNNLGWVLELLILFFVLRIIIKQIDKRKKILDPVRSVLRKIKNQRLIAELLFSLRFLKHPIDSFYYRKYENYLSITSASILYVLMFLEYLYAQYQTGFIFNSNSIEHTSLIILITKFFGPIILFIISNYLVSSINDGEGRFKDIYIGTIYSLVPYWLFLLPLTWVSRILTFNEAFIYSFSLEIMICWSAVIVFIMIKELHGYTISETIRNILLTLFCMIISVLVIFILYVLFKQLIDFVYSVIQEVILRV